MTITAKSLEQISAEQLQDMKLSTDQRVELLLWQIDEALIRASGASVFTGRVDPGALDIFHALGEMLANVLVIYETHFDPVNEPNALATFLKHLSKAAKAEGRLDSAMVRRVFDEVFPDGNGTSKIKGPVTVARRARKSRRG